MSLFVTLPSNGADLESDYGKKTNTQTDFEIDLKIPLDLTDQYRVGLSEITFRRNWLVNLGTFTVFNSISNNIVKRINIEVLDGLSFYQICNILNGEINNYHVTNPLINTQSNRKIEFDAYKSKKLEIKIPIGIHIVIEGYFTNLIHLQSHTHDNFYGITFMRDREKKKYAIENSEIGNNKLTLYGSEKKSVVFFTSEFIRYIENIYVYCDAIEDVHVGNSMLKLLRMVPITGKFDELITINYPFPDYLKLDSRFIEKIRMILCDSEGNRIRFASPHSRVVYKLHFKSL